jgi:erythromycin esterase-like protein
MDSKDIATISENLAPINGAVRMIKQSTAHVIAIGEGSHGTKEFYANRCEITKQLIMDKRCHCVLIEGDWPDTASLHRYVTGMSKDTLDQAMGGYQHFPRWMWRNQTMRDFVQWLHDFNAEQLPAQRVGIFGMDVYSLHLSMSAVLAYLADEDPELAKKVAMDYSCFDKFGDDAQTYGQLVHYGAVPGCRNAAIRALHLVGEHTATYTHSEEVDDLFAADDAFIAQINAEVVVDAEKYYTSMFAPEENSWNIRDTHFFDVVMKVQKHFQITRNASHMVLWAHNSHLGDARYTHLDASRFTSGRELNVGQLLKEKLGADCLNVGQLTHNGQVMASDDWGSRGYVKVVRIALNDSFEEILHACAKKADMPNFTLDLRTPAVTKAMANNGIRLERAIGVIYRPQTERLSHYFFCDLANQFDLMCFFDTSSALEPLDKERDLTGSTDEPETFPSGY